MEQRWIRRGVRVGSVVLTLLATTTNGFAQSAPARPAGRLTPDEVAAFATLSLSVAQVRDSIQKQLAQPRNKTPQAQQQLRDQLATQVASILQRAGVSEEEFHRKTYIVSTDS